MPWADPGQRRVAGTVAPSSERMARAAMGRLWKGTTKRGSEMEKFRKVSTEQWHWVLPRELPQLSAV